MLEATLRNFWASHTFYLELSELQKSRLHYLAKCQILRKAFDAPTYIPIKMKRLQLRNTDASGLCASVDLTFAKSMALQYPKYDPAGSVMQHRLHWVHIGPFQKVLRALEMHMPAYTRRRTTSNPSAAIQNGIDIHNATNFDLKDVVLVVCDYFDGM
jgi:hypothetical protein